MWGVYETTNCNAINWNCYSIPKGWQLLIECMLLRLSLLHQAIKATILLFSVLCLSMRDAFFGLNEAVEIAPAAADADSCFSFGAFEDCDILFSISRTAVPESVLSSKLTMRSRLMCLITASSGFENEWMSVKFISGMI